MPQGIHAESSYEVEIPFAFEVIKEGSLPAFESDWISIVGGKKIALLKIGNLFQTRHGYILERQRPTRDVPATWHQSPSCFA